MKMKEFDEILIGKFHGTFLDLGYKFHDSCYFKNRDNGFRNVISFDYDGEKSFRIIVGINYPYDQMDIDFDKPPIGARLCYFFTGGSLSDKPRDFVFKNVNQLDQHLDRFLTYFLKDIKDNFFGSIKTPETYADRLSEVDCIAKYEIYKNEAILDKALTEAKTILDSYKNMMDIPKIKNFIENDVIPFIGQAKGDNSG